MTNENDPNSTILTTLNDRFAAAITAAFPDAGEGWKDAPLIKPTQNPKFGEFQCNAAMALAKTLCKPPREVAKAIIGAVKVDDIAMPFTTESITGPGFINIILRPATDAAATALAKALSKPPHEVAAAYRAYVATVRNSSRIILAHARAGTAEKINQ